MNRRLRTFTLWIGTLLCVLIAAAFVVSGWWSFGLDVKGGPFVMVVGGTVWLGIDDVDTRWVFFDPSPMVGWWWKNFGWIAYAHVSLFSLFAVVAIPTLLVWRFWPKPVKPGHCRCGYDLTGLPEPRCPECGKPFEPRGDAP